MQAAKGNRSTEESENHFFGLMEGKENFPYLMSPDLPCVCTWLQSSLALCSCLLEHILMALARRPTLAMPGKGGILIIFRGNLLMGSAQYEGHRQDTASLFSPLLSTQQYGKCTEKNRRPQREWPVSHQQVMTASKEGSCSRYNCHDL